MIDPGARTLFLKEVRRFFRVWGQTVISPIITTALYLLVFGYALGGRLRTVHGIPYLDFIVPGLIMLGLVSNAFLNTSSSVIIMKMQGTLVDILVTPLSHRQIAGAMIGAAALRGLIVGACTWGVALFAQTRIALPHPLYAFAFPVLSAVLLAALGLLTGIWAEKIEQVNFFPTFVLTPLTFLGGVFYDVHTLPQPFSFLSQLNPVLYLVEGMRYGMLGRSSTDPVLGLAILTALTVGAVWACVAVIRTGWKLRS
ncbi:MAG: ABC transporter permease [Myxococcales bacterium]